MTFYYKYVIILLVLSVRKDGLRAPEYSLSSVERIKSFLKNHRTMSKTIQITNGPSREELFDGLRLVTEKRLLPFCVEKEEKEKYIAVLVSSIGAEDGSGQSWNLVCSISEHFISDSFFATKPKKEEIGVISKKVNFEFFKQLAEEDYLLEEFRKNLTLIKVYYSTKTRKGVISVG